MATGSDLKTIALARLNTVKILIEARDWDGAAYMMGYVLECTLKAASCKTLHIASYPDTGYDDISKFFRTHKFDPLLTISGLQDIFDARGQGNAFRNWSQFTQEYSGDWPSMRYERNLVWTENKVLSLYNNLVSKPDGIISQVKKKKRW